MLVGFDLWIRKRRRNRSTKAYRPFEVIYTEDLGDRKSAREREKFLKSGSGKEFLKRLK